MRLAFIRTLAFLCLGLTLALSGIECGGGSSSSPPPAATTLQFASSDYSVDENGGMVTVIISRSGTSTDAVGVDFATGDITATAGIDYTAASGTLNWPAGDVADKSYNLTVADDAVVEGDETVSLTLTNPGGGAVLGTQASAVLTILDDDTPAAGALQFSEPTYSVGEGGAAVTITVTRTGGSTGAITADYATSDSSATAPADYTAILGTLTWADGDSSARTFTVSVVDDALAEGDETLDLALSNPGGGAALGTQATAVLTIVDDDASGSLEFSSTNVSVSAYGGFADITVMRTGGSSGAVAVNYWITGNTATAGSDFTAVPGILTWNDGDATDKLFTITIVEDLLAETDETVDLTLTNPTGGANLGTIDAATLTIVEGWVKNPANPVLIPSSPGPAWDDGGVGEPCVLGPTSGLLQYSMWYMGENQGTGTEQIGYASSPDGVTWTKLGTPVLTPGAPGAWDENSVGGPSVFYDSATGTYALYYNGEDAMGVFRLGLATSTDGVIFIKSPANPILSEGPPGAWDEGAVAYASVRKDGLTFKMWYTAVDVFSPLGTVQIGYATSPDGVNWTKYVGNPVLSPNTGSFDALGVGFPTVIEDGSPTFRMIYTGNLSVAGMVPTALGYAVSLDGGITWAKYRDGFGVPVPILDVGVPGAWDDGAIFNSTWESIVPSEIWYQAEGSSGGSQIGYATHP